MTESSRPGRHVLYISYDGLTDQLGRSQVLPYLVGLSSRGHRIEVLSFEKPDRLETGGARVREICAAAGIGWHPLRYHKQPPILSTLWDLRAMARAAERLHRRSPFDLVHARSYLPAGAGLRLKRRHGVKLLFDMRGFWPDERVEGGGWPQSNPLYRAVYARVKRLESALLAGADHIVSLTDAGRKILERQAWTAPISVIPCCADFDHFRIAPPAERQAARDALGIAADTRVLVYLGSFGSWYMRDEMLDFFAAWRRRHADARFLVVTQDPEESVLAAARSRGLPAQSLVVRAATREQVPNLLNVADIGLFFIRPVPSKQASSPTKMAELMAVGLPILTNEGVGDVAAIIEETGCGVAIADFDEAAYAAAAERIEAIDCSPDRIRASGLAWFDVAEGIARYDAIYRSLGPN